MSDDADIASCTYVRKKCTGEFPYLLTPQPSVVSEEEEREMVAVVEEGRGGKMAAEALVRVQSVERDMLENT